MNLVEVFDRPGVADDVAEVVKWTSVISADVFKHVVLERAFDDLVVIEVLDQHWLENDLEDLPLQVVDVALKVNLSVRGLTKAFISSRVRPVLVSERTVKSIWIWTLVMNFSWKKV